MHLIDRPSGRSDAISRPSLSRSSAASDPRLDGVAQELAQAVARGDVSREQADAFLDRLSARASEPKTSRL